MVDFDCLIYQEGDFPATRFKCIYKVKLHCSGIGTNADDWAVVLISALYETSASAYAGKTRFTM